MLWSLCGTDGTTIRNEAQPPTPVYQNSFATRGLFHKSSFSHEIQNCVTSSVCPLAPGGPHLPCPLRPVGTHESYLHPDRMIGAV